jgi:hypothetical protein
LDHKSWSPCFGIEKSAYVWIDGLFVETPCFCVFDLKATVTLTNHYKIAKYFLRCLQRVAEKPTIGARIVGFSPRFGDAARIMR